MTGESDDIPPPSYKIVLLGESSVGKTSLVHRFITNQFDIHTTNTIGAAFITKVYASSNNPDRKVKLQIWDTAGQERYRSLTPMYYRNAKIALICIDLQNFEQSFVTAKYWIEQLELNNSNVGEDIRIHLIGTKLDLLRNHNAHGQQLSEEEIVEKLNEYRQNFPSIVKVHKTSSKDGTGITELFDEIIENIDEEFFTNYYLTAEPHVLIGGQGGQIGSMLNSRGVVGRGCC